MKGYKVFEPDWTCRGFQYKVGQTYEFDGEISLCESGFHFCKKLNNCFNYYEFNPKNKIALIEATGEIIDDDGDKQVTNKISIIEEITWEKGLTILNTGASNTGRMNSGHRNSGDGNSGDWNSGDGNSGDWNSGDRNSGHRNSGDWNSGDGNSGHRNSGNRNNGDWNSTNHETGFFNSQQSGYINVFNKPCKKSIWDNAVKPDFIFFNINKWVYDNNMSDKEKTEHPDHKITGGYLKTLGYKDAWREAYNKATPKDIQILKALPNFDAEVFEEISGIKVN